MEKKLISIPLDTPYGVIDSRTGQVVYRTTYANRKRASSFADRKDNAFGAVRFTPQILNS